LLCASAASSWANVISGSTGDLNNPPPFTVLSTTNENQKADEVGGLLVTATFGTGGGTATCTFANNSNVCTSAGNFSLTITPANQNTSAATWEIRNLRTGTAGTTDDLISVMMDGTNANNGVPGLGTVFNPCVTSTSPLVFNLGGGCSGAGTGNGESIQSHSGGITGVTATVFYDKVVMLSTDSVPGGNLWFRATMTFSGTTFEGQGSGGGTAFLFDGDTDMVDIPEPATYGLVGLALAAFGAFRLRKRES